MDEESIGLVNCGICDKELLGERATKFFDRNFTTKPPWVTQPPVAGRIWAGVRHMPLCRDCLATRSTCGHSSIRYKPIRHARYDEDNPWQQNNVRILEEM